LIKNDKNTVPQKIYPKKYNSNYHYTKLLPVLQLVPLIIKRFVTADKTHCSQLSTLYQQPMQAGLSG
jgi:hypothetical protein